MAAHSSILAWSIPWIEESGWLWSMGFSRQEYWSGLPFPSPEYGIEFVKSIQMHGSFLSSKSGIWRGEVSLVVVM